ncbi:MAG: aminotransferase class I/II-fold pyridoxal phosphate-dependent enzyme [Bacteroidetes bacterium]|nr:MAG: aminotransferase class I/II-fold pyridoxal phosphate-dependent enzyme [Bacteroidota bacterium]
MAEYSQLAETLIGSEIVKLGNQIRQRKALGETIYNFTIGDFDPQEFPIPALLEAEIVAAYQQHCTSYPAAEGELDLRQAVSAFVAHWQQLHYDTTEIQIASGGRPLIYAIFRTLVDAGDKVIYAVPSWNNNHYAHMTGAEHCLIPALPENNFMPLAADVEPHLPGATLLCLCTPQNPTGTTLPTNELDQICRLVMAENARRGPGEKKLYVMYDQMYSTLTYGNISHANPVTLHPGMKPYTVFVDGISKAFCATGVRVGWSLGPAPLIAKMKAILSHVGAWAPMAEQKATAKFLVNNPAIKAFLAHYKKAIEQRLTQIYDGLVALKVKGLGVDAIAPQAAIYLTVKIDLVGKTSPNGACLVNQEAVTAYLLQHASLAVVPFYCFGAPRESPWYRLSVGTCRMADIGPMLEKLEAALTDLE